MSKLLNTVTRWAAQQPDKVAINDGLRDYRYKQLSDEIRRISHQLGALQGKTVAIEIENSAAWIIIDLACIVNKICTVPIPAFFTQSQRAHALASSGAVAILGDNAENTRHPYFICGDKTVYIETLAAKSIKLPELTAKITYTSGSTGTPKGVCLCIAAMEQVADSILSVLGNEIGQNTAAVLPLPVLLENIAGCYATLLAGGCYQIHSAKQIGFVNPVSPDFKQLHHHLLQIKASSCILVPELLRGLMHTIARTQTSLPDMKYIAVGGSKVSSTLLEQASRLNLPVYQGYGLSEAASVVALNRPDKNNPASVGQLLPHVRLSRSDRGELVIQNPAFSGYVGSERGAQPFNTGDLGEIDQQGFIYLNGRKKNLLINSMGRNISPEWPESELQAQAEIMQSIVVGDGQAYLSALIVSSHPAIENIQINSAIKQANQRLPTYAQINKWLKVTPFTIENGQLTGTGRIRRDAILQQYSSLIETFYETPLSTSNQRINDIG